MRIFVSSSFEDLREHRSAVIRVLRQLGHEVLAMEDLTAASAAPLSKVLQMVDRSDAYVGVFAWRYGYVPGVSTAPVGNGAAPAASSANAAAAQPTGSGAAPPGQPAAQVRVPTVAGARYGETSITHYEYLRALERSLPVMAFLLDEQYPWPPQFIDGFDTTCPQSQPNANRIRELRQELQQALIVSRFTTPSDLEARVSAAVTTAGLTSQLRDLPLVNSLETTAGHAMDSSADIGITNAILAAVDYQYAVKIDLVTTWWSTRLYLLAALAERLTQVRRILVVMTVRKTIVVAPEAALAAAAGAGTNAGVNPGVVNSTTSPAVEAKAGGSPGSDTVPLTWIEEDFVGQLSTAAILATIGTRCEALGKFQKWLLDRPASFNAVADEIAECLRGWEMAFGDTQGVHTKEKDAKVDLTPELLRRWFKDAMLQQPVHIADLQRPSVVDLLRLLDYPNDYVPVLTRRLTEEENLPTLKRVDILDKRTLNARLARSYLVELMDRAKIVRNDDTLSPLDANVR